MIEAPIDSITEEHLQRLLGRPENRRLDFKADLPDPKEKKECNGMIADIVAFANSEGGDIIYGIEEEDGVAARIRPVTRTISLDKVIQRIYSWAQDNIDVRLPAFQVHAVPLAPKPGEAEDKAPGEALVIRVPPSLLAPHRSTMNGTSRFMGRNSRGNFEMDTTELREAFGAAAAIPERLKALHDEMLSRCERIRLPFTPPKNDPRLIVTVAPLSVLRPNQDIEFARVDASVPVSPGGQFGQVHDTPSLEGYIMHRAHPREPQNPRSAISWAISHRKGYIDQGWSITDLHATDGKTISKDAVDRTMWAAVSGAVMKLKSYRVEGPWVIMATAFARDDLPMRLMIEELTRTESRTVTLNEQSVILTDFQHRLWTKLVARQRLAVAAPTSAGKSFVLQNFLAKKLDEGDLRTVAYIVPTRALISQVSRDLRRLLAARSNDGYTIDVVTVPVESEMALPSRAVYVMTQERLQLMLAQHAAFCADIIIVDEAHTIAEGSRGILLHWVLEELLGRAPQSQLLFASPGVRNLDIFGRLLGLSDVEPMPSREATVGQNFLAVRVENPQTGAIAVYLRERGMQPTLIARRELGLRTVTRAEKLVNSACLFGAGSINIVYANGPGDAEDIALRLSKRFEGRRPTPAREALADMIAEAVHGSYALVDCVRKGIGFHYSNIPTQVREAIEKAVAGGDIDYLVCTSTLLQGVNLPAKNIFMCYPKKGKHSAIASVDFWNLAGRAGRLLKEYQGNIFLIEYENWKKQPLNDQRATNIIPAIEDSVLNRSTALLRIIGQPVKKSDDDLEAAFVRLLHDQKCGTLESALERMQAGQRISDEILASVRSAIVAVSDQITIPADVLRKSPNVSAHRQQRLYSIIMKRARQSPGAAKELLPKHPRDDGAYDSYAMILQLCHRVILGLKRESKFHRFLALIALWWMEGRPLPRIVQNQLDKYPDDDQREVVRKTLELVEREVRYQCVRLFSCYTAILLQVLEDLGFEDVRNAVPSVPLYLEIGASDRTMISLMALGVSRVVAMKLAPKAPSRNLDVAATRNWLQFRPLDSLGLSVALQQELAEILATFGERPALR